MNKSIWHTKNEKPTKDKTIFAQHKTIRDGCINCFIWEPQEFTGAIRKDAIAWTYLDDLIALETELERTRRGFVALQEFVTKLYLSGKITDEQLESIKKCKKINRTKQKDK